MSGGYKIVTDRFGRGGIETHFALDARNREIAARSDTVAAVVGVDTRNWKFTRILLSTNEPNGNEIAVAYQILHLAQPLRDTLPEGDGR